MNKKIMGLAVASVALVSVMTPAQAGGKGGFHFGHHWKHGHVQIHVWKPHRDCEWLYWKWKRTDRFKWKKRFYQCKGWW